MSVSPQPSIPHSCCPVSSLPWPLMWTQHLFSTAWSSHRTLCISQPLEFERGRREGRGAALSPPPATVPSKPTHFSLLQCDFALWIGLLPRIRALPPHTFVLRTIAFLAAGFARCHRDGLWQALRFLRGCTPRAERKMGCARGRRTVQSERMLALPSRGCGGRPWEYKKRGLGERGNRTWYILLNGAQAVRAAGDSLAQV